MPYRFTAGARVAIAGRVSPHVLAHHTHGQEETDRPVEIMAQSEALFPRLDGKTLVVKLGGATLAEQRNVLQDLLWVLGRGARAVVVHGGGSVITTWLTRFARPTIFEQGLRVTDEATLEVVRMVLLGQINHGLVMQAAQLGGKAISLCGTDVHLLAARHLDEQPGAVGEIVSVDPTLLLRLLRHGYLPLVAPLASGTKGFCLNVNADLVTAHLAAARSLETTWEETVVLAGAYWGWQRLFVGLKRCI